jgi:hypothetical protein
VFSREQAIVLLGHFVGDIHQPLHVSYTDDAGGNRHPVIFGGKLQSLHRLWDTGLLYCRLGSAGRASISWRRLGQQLHHAPLSPRLARLKDEQSVEAWANESLLITRKIYTQLPGKILPASYCDQFYPVAIERLQLAGYRLASLLSQTLVP